MTKVLGVLALLTVGVGLLLLSEATMGVGVIGLTCLMASWYVSLKRPRITRANIMQRRYPIALFLLCAVLTFARLVQGEGGGEAPIYLPIAAKPRAPTATPTSTPIPETGGLDLLPNHAGYALLNAPTTSWIVTGEVENQTSKTITGVVLALDFYLQKQLLETRLSTYEGFGYLPGGTTACIAARYSGENGPPTTWDRAVPRVVGYWTTQQPIAPLSVGPGRIIFAGGSYRLNYDLANTGTQYVGDIISATTLYDVHGRVVDCGRGEGVTGLAPGQIAEGTVFMFERRLYTDIARFSILAYGVPSTLPTPTVTPAVDASTPAR